MSNSLQSRIVTINNVTYTPINTPLGVSGQTTVQQIYKSTADDKFYIIAEGGTPEELGGGGGGTKLTGSLPTSGWTTIGRILWSGTATFTSSWASIGTYTGNKDDITSIVATIDGKNITLPRISQTTASNQYSDGSKYVGLYASGNEIKIAYYSGSTGVLTNLQATDVSSQIYTISDSAIKINSFAEMQLVSADEVRPYSKSDGSIVVEMDNVPTSAIPYELQIITTNIDSAFWIKNTYVPTKTSQLENDSNFLNEGFYYIDCSETAVDLDDYLSSNSVGIYILDKVTSNNVSNLPTEFEGINTIIMKLREFADGGHSQTIEWFYGITEIVDYKYVRTPLSTGWQRVAASSTDISITIPYANFVASSSFAPFTAYCLVTASVQYVSNAEYELMANSLITTFAKYGLALYNVEQTPGDSSTTDFYFLAVDIPTADITVTVKIKYQDKFTYNA